MTVSALIVSNEIYPVDRGGIGRLMHNFALANAGSRNAVDLHYLLGARLRFFATEIEKAFAGFATVHYCPDTPASIGFPIVPATPAYARDSLDQLMIESLVWYAGVLEAERRCGKSFDYVEFPDFGGWGAATIAAKRAGAGLHNTSLAVRLHSTFGIIADHEPFMHEPSEWMAARCDLERQCLRDADLVISHLASTARSNAEHLAFSRAWHSKVHIEMPPILLSEAERSILDEAAGRDGDSFTRDFLFSSRLQPFKRPDLFVRAAVKFLYDAPDSENLFRIASYGWDEIYVDWLKRLVPARWRERILFLDQLSEQERVRLMLESILVIPSDYESLCLLAFEARQMGVATILNRRCRAFGDEAEHWREDADCLFFDGDFQSLAKTMRRALTWKPNPAAPVTVPDKPYWEAGPRPATPTESPRLRLAFIVYGALDPYELASYLRELAGLRLPGLHVLVPRETLRAATISADGLAASGIVIHETSWLEPTPTEIESVVAQLDCDAVAFLPMDMRPEPGLWDLAARALGADPEAAVFTSHATVENEDAVRSLVLNFGDAPTVGLMSDRIAHRASIFRRWRLLEAGLREVAGDRWQEDLCIRLVRAGHRVLVAPALLARQRIASRTSRIQTSCFYASQQNEAAQQLNAQFRPAGLAHLLDSVVGIGHAAWVAQQERARMALESRAKLTPPLFHLEEAVLKNSSLDPGAEYKELELVLRGLAIGGVWIPWIGFKFSEYRSEAQLEFRESGNARHLFRSWPPATADQWGPVAVWSVGKVAHVQGDFFEDLPDADRRKLCLLLENLPSVLENLLLDAQERKRWKAQAANLLRPLQTERRGRARINSDLPTTAYRSADRQQSDVRGLKALARASFRFASRFAGWPPAR